MEKNNPLTNEYKIKHALATLGLIFVILNDKNKTTANSITKIPSKPGPERTLIKIFSLDETKKPVPNVTKSPITIQPNTLLKNLLFISPPLSLLYNTKDYLKRKKTFQNKKTCYFLSFKLANLISQILI